MKKTLASALILLSCLLAQGQQVRYEVSHIHDSINTTGSETAAVIVDDSIVLYTTMMPGKAPRLYLMDFNPVLSEIYQAAVDSAGTLGKGRPNRWGLNAASMSNGNVAFDPRNDMLYLTRRESGPKGVSHIYYARRTGKGWSKPQKMKGDVNLPHYNSSHPTVGYLPTGQTILYFSSDRPGGLGGMDLWYAVIISEGRPGNCANLGYPVNSDSNEVTPYYSNEEGVLYFSSNRGDGLGGFDVYRTEGQRNAWSAPDNLGEGVNTAYDDLYFCLQPCRCRCEQGGIADNEAVIACGFLASNRPGSLFETNENCCNDLYRWRRIYTSPEPLAATLPAAPPAATAGDLLPLILYFHNDEPDSRTLDTTTLLDYGSTLRRYLLLKEEYKGAQPSPVDPRKRDSIQKCVDRFFDRRLPQCHSDMLRFLELLHADLQAGRNVRITINGYASPLFESHYNVNLSKRRIDCFCNSLKRWNDGAIAPYLANGSLTIRAVANGAPDEQAVAGNSPLRNPASVRSVYDLEAAQNRRIDVVGYEYR